MGSLKTPRHYLQHINKPEELRFPLPISTCYTSIMTSQWQKEIELSVNHLVLEGTIPHGISVWRLSSMSKWPDLTKSLPGKETLILHARITTKWTRCKNQWVILKNIDRIFKFDKDCLILVWLALCGQPQFQHRNQGCLLQTWRLGTVTIFFWTTIV